MKISDIFKMLGKSKAKSTGALSNFYVPTAQAAKPVPTSYQLKDRGATITDDDIEAFRPILYGEASNRNLDKKILEGDVIFNTALNRQKEYARKGQNKTIAEILAMPNQYQAYNSPQYKEYHNPVLPLSVKKKKEIDGIVEGIKNRVKSGQFKDNTQGAYFYTHNPDDTITYDNKPLFK